MVSDRWGSLVCVITGQRRAAKPEEHVRQAAATALMGHYGYRRADIRLEFEVKMGVSRKAVDIAIFKPGAPHVQENILVVVECKRSDATSTMLSGVAVAAQGVVDDVADGSTDPAWAVAPLLFPAFARADAPR